jgi:hypothetical protein
MTRQEFDALEDELMSEIGKRQKLGGYSTDAPTLEFLCRAVLKLSQHLSGQLEQPSTLRRDR